MRVPGKIDYVEFACPDVAAQKAFYGQAFGWKFVDYGDAYASFEDGGLDGGFQSHQQGAKPLVVLFATDLEAMQAAVEAAGGEIVVPIFDFPGGRRFHFRDPGGNELAVWSEI